MGIDLLFKMFGKSLMYSKNNKGPKIDPWGTSYLNTTVYKHGALKQSDVPDLCV
jgi:hypothetical protein